MFVGIFMKGHLKKPCWIFRDARRFFISLYISVTYEKHRKRNLRETSKKLNFLEVPKYFKVASPVEYADTVQCYDISKRHPAFRATLAIIQSEILFSGRSFKKMMDTIIHYSIDLFDNPIIEQLDEF